MDESNYCDAIIWILVGLFGVVFLATLYRWKKVMFDENKNFLEIENKWTVRKIVHCLLPLPLIARIIDMSINHASYFYVDFQEQPFLMTLLGSIPGYLFFSTYSLLFCFWLIVFYQAYSTSQTIVLTLKKHYLALNIIVYTIWGTLMIFLAITNSKIIHSIEAIFAAIIAFGSFIAFSIAGIFVYHSFSNQTHISHYFWETSKKIGILAFSCSFIFALRGILVLCDYFATQLLLVRIICIACFQTFLELFPTCLTLYLLRNNIIRKKDPNISTIVTNEDLSETQKLLSSDDDFED